MKAIYVLDEQGLNPVPAGHVLVEDDVAFMENALIGRPLFIRGRNLCQWAKDLCRARSIKFQVLSSPLAELMCGCPGLVEDAAKQILAKLPVAKLRRPADIRAVAALLWPDVDLWTGQPGAEHAVDFLWWFSQRDLAPAEEILVKALASEWRITLPADFRHLYAAQSPQAAWALLCEWLGITPQLRNWPPIPWRPFPPLLFATLKREWTVTTVQSGGIFLKGLIERGVHRPLLQVAAEVVAKYYQNNPKCLDAEKLHRVARYVSEDTYRSLRQLLPPEPPAILPTSVEDVVEWFMRQYLPFREWVRDSRRQEQRGHLEEIAREFGLWYLHMYAQARVGGSGSQKLSWCRTAHLGRGARDSVTLLIVLDGLCYEDGRRLCASLEARSPRLALDFLDIVLAPLPTVTSFAKAALLAGAHPARALEETPLGIMATKDQDVVGAVGGASAGQVIIWSVVEPDRTYHNQSDPVAAVHCVRRTLEDLADRIRIVAEAVPPEIKLRIVITTDHGRLMDFARCLQPPPSHMQAHGRAAWGPFERTFEKSGVLVEGDVAYLHPQRFGLPVSCAILLSGDAFSGSSGTKVSEAYPHGGVYPEEVFIPWAQFTRDRKPLDLSIAVNGSGTARARGELQATVLNPSDLVIRITRLELPALKVGFDLEEKGAAMSTTKIGIAVAVWPTADELRHLQEGYLYYSLPSGDGYRARFEPEMTSQELYVQTDILGDLEN